MRIAVVGGRLKSDDQLTRIAHHSGHQIDFHEGDLHGRGVDEIRAIVARSELVVIVTEINSHGGVLAAKKAARQYRTPSLVVRKLSGAKLKTLCEALEARRRNELAALAATPLAAVG